MALSPVMHCCCIRVVNRLMCEVIDINFISINCEIGINFKWFVCDIYAYSILLLLKEAITVAGNGREEGSRPSRFYELLY